MNITVGNSMSQIQDMTIEQYARIREVLCYELPPEQAYYQGSHRPTKRYLVDKKGNFPTGLLPRLTEYAHKVNLGVSVKDTRVRPMADPTFPVGILAHKPYEEQRAAADACFKAGQGVVCAPTGVGKSAIAAMIIMRVRVNTLIVVPTLELKSQLTSSLSTVFGEDFVGPDKRIYVSNVDSLPLEPLRTKYDCVIIDEFHHSGANTYRKLNAKAWGGIFYKFGLTATPFRSQDHETILLESVLSKVIYRIEYIKAVEKGYIVPLEAYYYELPVAEVKGYNWAQVYNELVVNNLARNALIGKIIDQLDGKPTLCLVKEIKHGENLLAVTSGVPFVQGANPLENRIALLEFNLGLRKALIGTTGVLGEGVDSKPAEYVIIAGLGKSKNAFMQQCGRGFRVSPGKESCKIVLFYDKSHKWSKAHFKAQCKILFEEYGVKPERLVLPV